MFKRLMFLLLCLAPFALPAEYPSSMGSMPNKIIVNNRPLIKVNGKVISLIDVVQKMDLFAYEHAPQIMESLPSRYQYYMQNWLPTLQDMIQLELILADAETKEIKVSDGDIREEVLERFGPRLMARLDELGLTYEEARELVRKDLIEKKMRNFKIYSKAFQSITPSVIKENYDQHIASNPPLQEWEYKVISLRGKQEEALQSLSSKLGSFLAEESLDVESALEKLKEEDSFSLITTNVSGIFKYDEKAISEAHKTALSSLCEGSYSEPIKQISRDKSVVYRIFYLIKSTKKEPPTFEEKSEEIKNQLINTAIDRETKNYMSSLQKRFGITNESLETVIPKNFQPFTLGQ